MNDHQQWPVSIKGVVIANGHVLLLKNERHEWELPGGRLEIGESPEECLRREVREETGVAVQVDRVLDAWVYPVLPDRKVLIVTYRCLELDAVPQLQVSSEHSEARFVALADCGEHPMPGGYRRSINAAG